MPELPEVETTKRGITPLVLGQTIARIDVRQPQLRQPVTPDICSKCRNKNIEQVTRRAKYLLLHLSDGCILIHLGMSGHLRLVSLNTPADKHDHIDVVLENGQVLRYHDPRRFGLWLYLPNHPFECKWLASLGPEPLTSYFDSLYLFHKARGKKQCIKTFIMNNQVVVGIGNIYATESLFLAGIHPLTPTGSIHLAQFEKLAYHIKAVLQQAIDAGGTTLKDFYSSTGKPGYFATKLLVYGRQGLKCVRCKSQIKTVTIANRSSAYCPGCQPELVSSV